MPGNESYTKEVNPQWHNRMIPLLTSTLKSRFLTWLTNRGVRAIAIIKLTGRSLVYILKSGKKGCTFIPKALLEVVAAPVSKKENKIQEYWLVIDHECYPRTADYQLVELNQTQVKLIKDQGGLIFDLEDKRAAIAKTEELNFPVGYQGATPRRFAFGERDHFFPRFLNVGIVKA